MWIDTGIKPRNDVETLEEKLRRIIPFKVYKDDVLVLDFQPCLDPDGVPCLYEAVKGRTWYYDAETNQMVAGGAA